MATEIQATQPSAADYPAASRRETRPCRGPISAFRRLPGIARLAVGLEIFVGIGALYGGSQFILAPDGHLMGLPVSLLTTTPFRSYLVPGILLFTCIGLFPIMAAVMTVRRQRLAPLAAVAVGVTLMVWITVEMVMFAGASSLLWAVYLALGTGISAVGVAWLRYETRANDVVRRRGMNKPLDEPARISGRSGAPLADIALYISTVVAGTAVAVLIIRGLTDSWAAGSIIGAVATGLSVGGYAWLNRAHHNRRGAETV